MVLPLLPIMIGGMAVSGAANLYSQYNQRRMYRPMANAYKNLDQGYRSYLATQGKSINPDRAWTSYYGQYRKAQTNLENSYAGSVGTLGGTIGGTAGFAKGLFGNVGKTSRRL